MQAVRSKPSNKSQSHNLILINGSRYYFNTNGFDRMFRGVEIKKQKFNKIRPQTLGQAGRISGVNPSDVQILMVYMGR